MWGKTTVTMSRHLELDSHPRWPRNASAISHVPPKTARTSKKRSACLSCRMRFAKPSKLPLAMPFRGFGMPAAPCRFPHAPRGPLSYFAKHSEQPRGLFPVGDRQTQSGSTGGDLVTIRLRRAAEILDGGWIRYYCWGSPKYCTECRRQPPTYFACSSWGKRYVICLGTGFWKAWRDRDEAKTASTLVHEALHIYFGSLIAHGEKGRYGNANCYQRFVLLINDQFLHPVTAAACARHANPC
jgi:hypothetical protein